MQTAPETTHLYSIKAPFEFAHPEILTPHALDFITSLHRQFNRRRLELLMDRNKQKEKFSQGKTFNFDPVSADIRNSIWTAKPVPEELNDRRVELTGSTDLGSLINGINSGARVYIADFGEATSWDNLLLGQLNLQNIILGLKDLLRDGNHYKLNKNKPVLAVRPRDFHLDENQILIEDEPLSASFFDFGLYFFTNAEALITNGSGPYFYLQGVENREEARLWNSIFEFSERELDLPPGKIRATVQIENMNAVFHMDEVIYELRDRIAGLNACFWNDVLAFLKNKSNGSHVISSDRPIEDLNVSYMLTYARLFVKTCHRRNIHAIGGVNLFFSGNEYGDLKKTLSDRALKNIESEAEIGFDGTLLIYPDLVEEAQIIFENHLTGRKHQKNKKLNGFYASIIDLLNPYIPKSSSRFADHGNIRRNLPINELIDLALKNKEGKLTDKGALAVTTGRFTGRCPDDKYIVRDINTDFTVNWGKLNNSFGPAQFDALYDKMRTFVEDKPLFITDSYGGAAEEFRLKLEVVTTKAWQSLFAKNQFLNPSEDEIKNFAPDWAIFCVPEFEANPVIDGTKRSNFTIINFTRKLVLIGGTEYAGEIKKSLFTILNYILPVEYQVLPMHCSATVGEKGDVALFFGLSGTGKTTLSADPTRRLVGDDEHGWADNQIFNFEGGCYAKVIRLDPEGEPRINGAIRYGSLLENVCFYPGSSTVNYEDDSLTENTRACYPLAYADIYPMPMVRAVPRNIFFLTADATGVLPPLAALTGPQIKAFFLTGYTSKLAGTEVGVIEPQPTFSACFGAAFLPLPPMQYADLLEKKVQDCNAKVWLVNTGWTGGKYGTGHRMPLSVTRALINAVLTDSLDPSNWKIHPVFGIAIPDSCPGVDARLLDPKASWADETAYLKEAYRLREEFAKHLVLYVGEKSASELFVIHNSSF